MNNGNVDQSHSNSNPSPSTSPSKARRRRKRNNKNKNKNQNQNNGNQSNQNSSKSPTKSNKKKRQKPSPKQAAKPSPNDIGTKLDRVQLSNKSKKNPWSKKQQSSAFENIMTEQAQSQKPIYSQYQPQQMNEEQLLEQQMIAMAIAASKKEQQELQLKEYQKYSKNDDEKQMPQNKENKEKKKGLEKEQKEEILITPKINEEEEKQIIENKPTTINDELIAATISAQSNINGNVKIGNQTLSDKALAIQLQQQEQQEYNRRQKMSQIYDGKYAKVTSSANKPTTIPKAALNFYYDDESMLHGGLTKEQYQEHLISTQASEESIIDQDENTNTESVADNDHDQNEEELVAISKHDAKIW
eukprot:CAMPEP_0201566184 /NCGR_PEP_ID=MMETSP0190_2-20130828/5774_1 /ASSEMBLY_ACC=CAM_ASM_000263 /TAXON_ID=37353 /ORGANISM="Rosalina sp." /LENGTH=357 /DNA_ID=CAMNT_0047984539 /DNA_START=181 /DNA_END=1251 /DNA_ORIENTATION=-